MSKIDEAISTINYLLKKKKKRVEEYSRRSTTTENEKIFIGDETQLISACEELIKTFKKDRMAHFGKMPPQSLDLEKKILGAIILENKLEKVIPFLLPQHFYSDGNARIYAACVAISPKVDLSTVVIHLRTSGNLEASGGAFYLSELIAEVVSSAHLEFHARILVELAIKREIIRVCGESLMAGYEDATDCFELLEQTEKGLSNIRAWIK